MARAAATAVVHIDDERFKVTEWRFAPGAETGWHVHGHDYVIVPLTDGVLHLEEPGGASRDAQLARHVPYSRRTGVEHNVVNGGDAPLSFLEVEVVDDPPHGQGDPLTAPRHVLPKAGPRPAAVQERGRRGGRGRGDRACRGDEELSTR
jgi:hypothetical protein